MRSASTFQGWKSDLTADQLFRKQDSFSYATPFNDQIMFLSPVLEENNRQALFLYDETGRHCITPEPFNLGTQINEYGGKPFWLDGDRIIFANREDQCLYQQTVSGNGASTPNRISVRQSDRFMYAELSVMDESLVLVIVEQADQKRENTCFLASLDTSSKDAVPHPIQQGADFYSNLVVDAKRNRVAWVEWNHPHMPWDDNQLWVADLLSEEGRVSLVNQRQVQAGSPASHCQLCFSENGRLFFSADRSGFAETDPENYWNIYALDLESSDQRVHAVSTELKEFGYPHWQFGDQRITQFDSESLISYATEKKSDYLYLIDQESLQLTLHTQFDGHVRGIASDGRGKLALIEHPQLAGPRIKLIEGDTTKVCLASSVLLAEEEISKAQHIEYACQDAGAAYGYYYAPTNSKYSDQKASPPLLVMVHGGPTGQAYGSFDIQKQYWTNRGFAIFDVNHRGSSGYGRNYRDALYGEWGELDTRDIVDGINHLIQQGLAHSDKVLIRGKSAGGYAVLRALTEYPALFKAGACYYGIGNLATLAEITHKFEKYYTDRLISEDYEPGNAQIPSSLFYTRSPINYIHKLSSAMIVFQGSMDLVVPPAVAHEIVSAFEAGGVAHNYVEYENEAHGFRQADNNIDALKNELAFYLEVLK